MSKDEENAEDKQDEERVLPDIGMPYLAVVYDNPEPFHTDKGETVLVPIRIDEVVTPHGPWMKRLMVGRQPRGKTKFLLDACDGWKMASDGMKEPDWAQVEGTTVGVTLKLREWEGGEDRALDEIFSVKEYESRIGALDEAAAKRAQGRKKPKK